MAIMMNQMEYACNENVWILRDLNMDFTDFTVFNDFSPVDMS